MKFGISTLALHPKPLENVLACIEELKIGYCEIINEYPIIDMKKDIIDSYSLNFILHTPISDINIASPNKTIRISSINEIKSSLDIASDIDAEKVVLHPGNVPFLARPYKDKVASYNFGSLKECADYADDLGLTLCLENMPKGEGLLCTDIKELQDLVDKLGIMTTLDVGHAHTMGFRVEEMTTMDRLGHIHISDNDGLKDSHDALGNGSIDFNSFFETLKGYNGVLTIEVKGEKELSESLRFLRKFDLL